MPKHVPTRIGPLLAAAAALAASSPLAAQQDECRFEAERTASVDAAGAELLEVIARAGGLIVTGEQGGSEVRARGRACASSEELLAEIGLSAERRDTTVRVEALMPDQTGIFNAYARLDLVIEAPAGIAADIDDSSGPMELARLGPSTVDDSSGSIRIEDISGALRIDDSSGEIDVARVRGDVEIDDSSGRIALRDIEGSVAINDSSGEIDARGISGSAGVHRDSAGATRAADVGGAVVAERRSSGGVSRQT